MFTSSFDLFKPGIGPSSSHTNGPMVAAARFAALVSADSFRAAPTRITVELFGSLALTGIGHGTDKAVLLGLAGHLPEAIDPTEVAAIVAQIRREKRLPLDSGAIVAFDPDIDLVFARTIRLPGHPNAMRFKALDQAGCVLLSRVYYSTGGGSVAEETEIGHPPGPDNGTGCPYPFASAAELLHHADRTGLTIAGIQRSNETTRNAAKDVDPRLDAIWKEMRATIERGCNQKGELPGGLRLRRRAPVLLDAIRAQGNRADPLAVLDWVKLWALAVNEENAAGGRVVTAPTMGAAGVVPAVIRYLEEFARGSAEDIRTFLLTAAAIGGLYKRNASISGAEVGCQGEVGVACSMAAAGLAAALGGSSRQIENAAEIGMEHNLGLTCDPVASLVQIPCIERNALAAVKAIDAARLALLGDGTHRVTLDEVIETMRKTGADMLDAYKETSRGGLALHVTAC